jgi:hypothetical protein
LPTAEKIPQTIPQKIVKFRLSPVLSGRKRKQSVPTTPTALTNNPRERSLRAKNLNTRSFTDEHARQQKVYTNIKLIFDLL